MASSQAVADNAYPARVHPLHDAVDHWRAEREYWLGRLEAYYKEAFGVGLDRLQTDDDATPGARVGVIQDIAKSNPDAFYATGARGVLFYLQELRDHGVDPASLNTVLEFGLGFGRLLRHWLPIGPRLFGCDVTPQAAEYCSDLFGDRASIHCNGEEPPLPYDDAQFDHVFANSVFTHIRGESAVRWAQEMARIIRPGGVAIFSALDDNVHLNNLSERELDQNLIAHGGVREWGRPGVRENYRYATDAAEHRLWSPWFEVLEIRRHFKDQRHVILRRKVSI
jgi:SAM-dependent methyltransferase